VREFGALLVEHRFFEEADDIFYLNRHEVWAALEDLMLAWAAGSEARGPGYWPAIVARRKEIMQRLREWTPPPALGPAPDAIEDPMTILLWGVTNEQLENWLTRQSGRAEAGELSGCAGSPGVVEGPARVLNRPDQLDELRDGEILVCPVTSPSWTPVFGRIKAAVSDIGGIMSHAAIVAREYGLPAVVGTGFGTTTIKTGQRIRVDGNRGVVTILD
jgi:pyruvate,water dikinase